MVSQLLLFDDHFLNLHVVAVDEAEHVDARSKVNVHGVATADFFAAQDATVDINHLEDSLSAGKMGCGWWFEGFLRHRRSRVPIGQLQRYQSK